MALATVATTTAVTYLWYLPFVPLWLHMGSSVQPHDLIQEIRIHASEITYVILTDNGLAGYQLSVGRFNAIEK